MVDIASLESRLATLEHEVASLKRQLAPASNGENWVDRISGSMKAFPEFEEVVRLGREFRETADDASAGTPTAN